MPLNKLPIGGPILEFPAATFNTMVDVTRQTQRESKKFARKHGRDHQPDSFKWKNTSDEDCPRGGLIFFEGVVDVDNAICVTGTRPNTTFRQLFGVALAPCKAGAIGDATIGPGPVKVKYSGTAPTANQGWGPKPGQWEAARGYFGLVTLGVVGELAIASIGPMKDVLVKTTNGIPRNATTQNYRIYAGATLGSETDAGFTTVPSARNRGPAPLHDGSWAWLAWTGSGWDLRQDHRVSIGLGTAAFDIAPGGTGAVLSAAVGLFDNAVNASQDAYVLAGDNILVWREPEDNSYRCIPLRDGIRWYEARLDGPLSVDDSTAIVDGAIAATTGQEVSFTEARNPFELSGLDNDRVLIVETPGIGDPPYLLVQVVRRRPRWFRGTLSETVAHDTDPASVNTTAALDGGDHPETVNAANPYQLAATNGSPCLIVEDHDSEGYLLVQVRHVVKEVAVSVDWDSPDLTITKQPILVMHEAEPNDPDTIVAGDEVTYVSSVDWSSPNLTQTLRTAVVFGDAADDTETIVAADTATVVIDVDVSGTTLRQTKRELTVLNADTAGSPSPIDEGTECDA